MILVESLLFESLLLTCATANGPNRIAIRIAL